MVAELPATGGVVPSWNLRTVKLLRYVTPSDYFVLACEIIFMLFIVYYCIEEAIEVCRIVVATGNRKQLQQGVVIPSRYAETLTFNLCT